MPFFAHSGTPGDTSDWQSLDNHLLETASLAAKFAAPFGLERPAFLTALFHDLGKYDPRFQERLTGKNIRVDHSTAGACVLRELASGLDGYTRVMAELAGYAILGHHAGLPDKKTDEPSCFVRRVEGFEDKLDTVWKKEVEFDLSGIVPEWLPRLAASPHLKFDLSVLVRFLFSCLVDADFKNTEEFYTKLEKREVDREWPTLQGLLPDLRARFDAHMAGLKQEGDLNALRRDILAHVRGKAGLPSGLFTLTVPTGGGKTLASLGFALDHAAAHGHSRIIYAIPFTRARIETTSCNIATSSIARRPPHAGADRNIVGGNGTIRHNGRPPHASADRNASVDVAEDLDLMSPAPRWRVSKLEVQLAGVLLKRVARPTRARIET